MEFFLQSREDYRRIREQLQQQNVLWLLPYVEEHFRRQYLPEMEAEIEKVIRFLLLFLHFVIFRLEMRTEPTTYNLLNTITFPEDLRRLSVEDL